MQYLILTFKYDVAPIQDNTFKQISEVLFDNDVYCVHAIFDSDF
jgi:hypothetical protein